MIQGDKTSVRPLGRDDLSYLHRWLNDPEVMQYWQGRDRPLTMEDIERLYLSRIEGMDPLDPTLRCFTIEAEGRPIGLIQYSRLEREDRTAEIDVFIGDRGFWGRGYGTDAILAFLGYLFNELKLHRVWLAPQVLNARAIRAYEKAGFVREGVFRESDWFEGHFMDTVVMSILEQEYRARRDRPAPEGAA
ncbi:MAG: GNAT family N-acetyltransferase [Dehalococcoidia bacterium]